MKIYLAGLMAIAVAACGRTERADEAAKTTAPSEQAQPVAPSIDPAAITALQRMGAYLRTLTSFEVRTRTSIDEVLVDSGQKVQFAGEGLYRVRRPNAFYVEANTDRRQRRFYYDGSTFTMYSPRMKVYAQRPAPGTIRETIDQIQEHYDIPMPLADLFYWGEEPPDAEAVVLASHIGFARVQDQASDHYAFRQGDLDWQIWIARGDRPLPLKVVVTTRTEPEQPQYTADLTWNLNPRFSPATFAFRPPSDAHAIQIAAVEGASAE